MAGNLQNSAAIIKLIIKYTVDIECSLTLFQNYRQSTNEVAVNFADHANSVNAHIVV